MNRELLDTLIIQTCKYIQDVAEKDMLNPVCIAVYDRNGLLSFFIRMLDAVKLAIPLAHEKAKTSALMGVSTRDIHERLVNENLSLADFCGSATTGLVGGVPIVYQGLILGGVGVSGRKPEDDEKLAYLFATHFVELLESEDL